VDVRPGPRVPEPDANGAASRAEQGEAAATLPSPLALRRAAIG